MKLWETTQTLWKHYRLTLASALFNCLHPIVPFLWTRHLTLEIKRSLGAKWSLSAPTTKTQTCPLHSVYLVSNKSEPEPTRLANPLLSGTAATELCSLRIMTVN